MKKDTNIKTNMAAHGILMRQRLARGEDRKLASQNAYDELLAMPLADRRELVEGEQEFPAPAWSVNAFGREELKLKAGVTATLDWEGPDRVEGLVTAVLTLKPCRDMATGKIVAQTAMRAMLRTALRELDALEGKNDADGK